MNFLFSKKLKNFFPLFSKRFKKNFSLFLSEKIIEEILILSFLFNVFLWIFVLVKIEDFNVFIPLQYNFLGEALKIGEARKILYYPASGFLILAGNLILAYLFYFKDKLFSYFILAVSLFAQIFIFLFLFHLLANI